MFIHNFKYTFKTLFKNKILIFWTFAFPVILGTFFNMAFSNIEKSEKLEIIDIAIVDNHAFKNNEVFVETFKVLSDEKGEERLFNTKYVKEDKAKDLLQNDEIDGYLVVEKDEPKIIVKTNGINETILKYVTEEISQTGQIIKNIKDIKSRDMLENGLAIDINQEFYKKIHSEVVNMLEKDSTNIENISSRNLSYTMIEFYTLIAMACLYGGILGMAVINQNLANMSNKGKRISISPISKGKVILGSICASYITQLIGIAILFIYTIFVLNVNYGDNLFLIILLAMAGCLAGLSLGIAIGTLLKSNENIKIGIIMSITMLWCYLSGMMGITMKYVVDKNIPIINKINPANMITDGFYSLYYYDTLDRYIFDIISLLIFAFILIVISFTNLRRQKYDSI